jgi:hypothetical protein
MWKSLSKRYDVVQNPKAKIYSEEFKKRGMEMPKGTPDFASTGDSDEPVFTLKIKKEEKPKEEKVEKSEESTINMQQRTKYGR